MKQQPLEDGEWRWSMAPPHLLSCVWRDTTQSGVWFLSTCHDGRESGGEVRRRRRGSASLMKTAPVVAIDYNKYMCGCDQANSLRASYNTYLTHKKRWYMSLFYYGIDVFLVNALIYYNTTHSTTQSTHKVFRLRVVQLFAARSLNRQRSVTEDECGPRKRCNPDTLGARAPASWTTPHHQVARQSTHVCCVLS